MPTANFPAAPPPPVSPTAAEIRDAYLQNADWEAEQDLTKAKAFLTAAIRLQAMTPRQIQKASQGLMMSPELLTQQIAHVRAFVRANTSGGAAKVLRPSFREFRT